MHITNNKAYICNKKACNPYGADRRFSNVILGTVCNYSGVQWFVILHIRLEA